MATPRDTYYYEVLGLSPDASEDEIKKAYRKMALRWHPDKNQDNLEEADKKFKEIGEAYSVLSDPEKKKLYDMYGKNGIKEGGFAGYASANDIFEQFFGTSNVADIFDRMFAEMGGFEDDLFPRRSSKDKSRGGFGFGAGFGSGFGAGFGSGFGSGFDDFGGFSSSGNLFNTTISGGGSDGSGYTSSTSTTRTVNGKTITTKTTKKDGNTIVEIIKNGKLTERRVNGVREVLAVDEQKRLK